MAQYPIAGIQQYAATTSFRMLPVAQDVIDQAADVFEARHVGGMKMG